MPVTPVLLEPNGEYIELIPTACLHIGSAGFMEKRALKHRAFILDSPDRYTWDMGDTTENASRHSIGAGVYAQDLSPRKQQEYAEEYYQPLRDRGKLLGIHNGNHGFRSEKEVDYSPAESLAKELNVPYLGWQNVFRVKVGRNNQRSYSLFSWHGKCNARTPGAILNALTSLPKLIAECDAYIMAHVHDRQIHQQPWRRPGKTRIIDDTQYFASCGAFLRYEESYADMQGLPPRQLGDLIIRLYKSEPHIELLTLDI